MFRNRQSSQRPPEEFIERFKQVFPGVRTSGPDGQPGHHQSSGLQDSTLNQGSRFPHDHDLDPTPRAAGSEPFRFTPSLLDPNSSAFHDFANQPAGIYTPAQPQQHHHHHHHGGYGGVTDVLQTPNFGLSLDTPLGLSGGATSMAHHNDHSQYISMSQTLQAQQFHGFSAFTPTGIQPQYVEPGYGRAPSGPGSPMDISGVDPGLHLHGMHQTGYRQEQHTPQIDPYNTEKFRFHVTLHAPTAMVKNREEIPVTYLNKGQAYTVTVQDKNPQPISDQPLRYRTYIRISFHDESQRQRPEACWQLWKEGRGTNEAHQRGGKLQAVEYVENPGPEQDGRTKVELESSSFDSFVVNWSPPPGGPAEGSVSVRFNFLSTDFSHSKGVKGIPVRFCAKTEQLGPDSSPTKPNESMEICYCKVKLFRDHGAERKLANDILHIRKTIEKLRQQAQQLEGTGMKLFGKKKRDDDMKHNKVGKAPKHKRTWSMSSASSVAGGKSAEEDTEQKLIALESMFSSTRSASVLFLRGSEEDDPDLHPVHLPGDQHLGLSDDDSWARRRSSVTTGSFVSPSPSSASLASQAEGLSPQDRNWSERSFTNMQQRPTKVRGQSENGMLSGWIEAIDIDQSYSPPAINPAKAVMCIYILPVLPGQPEGANHYHRAVYLMERTAQSLIAGVAAKCGIDSSSVARISYVTSRGLNVQVDDDFVRQMTEGQDMKVQAVEIEESGTLSPPQDYDQKAGQKDARGWELRLVY